MTSFKSIPMPRFAFRNRHTLHDIKKRKKNILFYCMSNRDLCLEVRELRIIVMSFAHPPESDDMSNMTSHVRPRIKETNVK